jgi:hypothetical protein
LIRQQQAAEARRNQEEAAADARQTRLRSKAEARIKDPARCVLWLTTSHHTLRERRDGPPVKPLDLAAKSEDGLKRVLELLARIKL